MTPRPTLKQAAEKALLALHMNRSAVDATLRKEAEDALRLALGTNGQNVPLFDTMASMCRTMDALEAKLVEDNLNIGADLKETLYAHAENLQALMGYLIAHVEHVGGINGAEAQKLLETAHA